MMWHVFFCLSLSLVLNPHDVIGSCGLFIARDFRTTVRTNRRGSYVDVLCKVTCLVGSCSEAPAIYRYLSLL